MQGIARGSCGAGSRLLGLVERRHALATKPLQPDSVATPAVFRMQGAGLLSADPEVHDSCFGTTGSVLDSAFAGGSAAASELATSSSAHGGGI